MAFTFLKLTASSKTIVTDTDNGRTYALDGAISIVSQPTDPDIITLTPTGGLSAPASGSLISMKWDNIISAIDESGTERAPFSDRADAISDLSQYFFLGAGSGGGGGGGSDTYLGLTDTPNINTGQAGKFVRVNATENSHEYVDLTGAMASFDNSTAGFIPAPTNIQAAVEAGKTYTDVQIASSRTLRGGFDPDTGLDSAGDPLPTPAGSNLGFYWIVEKDSTGAAPSNVPTSVATEYPLFAGNQIFIVDQLNPKYSVIRATGTRFEDLADFDATSLPYQDDDILIRQSGEFARTQPQLKDSKFRVYDTTRPTAQARISAKEVSSGNLTSIIAANRDVRLGAIAEQFSATNIYGAGDLCIQADAIHRCNTTTTLGAPFNELEWTKLNTGSTFEESKFYLIGDTVTTITGTYYGMSDDSKGTIPQVKGTAVIVAGTAVGYSTEEFLSDELTNKAYGPQVLTAALENTSGVIFAFDSSYKIEMYLTTDDGTPIDPNSGLAPGSLGVSPIALLETVTHPANAPIPGLLTFTGDLTNDIYFESGQRMRLVIGFENKGTIDAANDHTAEFYFGLLRNSYIKGIEEIVAKNVLYFNKSSGLAGDHVQQAIDELADGKIIPKSANFNAGDYLSGKTFLIEDDILVTLPATSVAGQYWDFQIEGKIGVLNLSPATLDGATFSGDDKLIRVWRNDANTGWNAANIGKTGNPNKVVSIPNGTFKLNYESGTQFIIKTGFIDTISVSDFPVDEGVYWDFEVEGNAFVSFSPLFAFPDRQYSGPLRFRIHYLGSSYHFTPLGLDGYIKISNGTAFDVKFENIGKTHHITAPNIVTATLPIGSESLLVGALNSWTFKVNTGSTLKFKEGTAAVAGDYIGPAEVVVQRNTGNDGYLYNAVDNGGGGSGGPSQVVFSSISTADHGQNIATHAVATKVGYIYEVTLTQHAVYDNESDIFTNDIHVDGTRILHNIVSGAGGNYNNSGTVAYFIDGDGSTKSVNFRTTYSSGLTFHYTACIIKEVKKS